MTMRWILPRSFNADFVKADDMYCDAMYVASAPFPAPSGPMSPHEVANEILEPSGGLGKIAAGIESERESE